MRGSLTRSMFGNFTGTYPGIQAALYEPERQLPITGWIQIRWSGQSSTLGRDSRCAEKASIFNEVKTREVGSGTLTGI